MNTRNIHARALQHVLGEDQKAIFTSVLLLLTLGITINGSYELLRLCVPAYLTPLPFLFLFGYVYWQYRNTFQKLTEPPRTIKHLVLFLSPSDPRKELPEVTQFIQELPSALDFNTALTKLDQSSWKMPLVAINHHHHHDLKQVLVIPSADQKGKPNGTYRELENFKKILQLLFPNLKIEGIDSANGVNFESPGQLLGVLEEMYKRLNLPDPRELVIDFTGGQKPTSMAGVHFAEEIGCHFQYVSTLDNNEVIIW